MFKLLLQILKDQIGVTLAITRVTANTLITAGATNNRADEVEAVVNALTSANFAADSVLAAALGSDVVRAGYGLIQNSDGSLYVDLSDTNPGLELTDGGIRVASDESSIERFASGLRVKALGITNAMLAGLIDLTTKVVGILSTALGGTGSSANANAAGGVVVPVGAINSANGAVVLDANSKIPVGQLGAWVDKSASYGAQQAATDGIVIAIINTNTGSSGVYGYGYTDVNANPTTVRGKLSGNATINSSGTITMPVKKGDYWKITNGDIGGTVVSVYWIPLGA